MVRVQLRFARPELHLAHPVTGPGGGVLVGAGTRLEPAAVRSLLALGVRSVWVEEADRVASWEEDRDLEPALAALAARFAGEPENPVLRALEDALRRRLVACARGPSGGGA